MSDVNEHGVPRRPCRACGDCTTGCNHMAKSTLYMNYLPMARNAGAKIFTETKVEWIERLPGGGWRVHGTNSGEDGGRFKLDAANVILAAGSINTTEILMRSEMHGLSLSPAVGSRFSCNGDFFGLAYNGDFRTQVTGFGNHDDSPAAEYPPGPAIVSAIHYNGTRAVTDRFQIEDLTIPTAYIAAARRAFPMLQREDTDSGDEAEERRRIQRDLDPTVAYDPDGALNHTMFYLVMAFDDARGRMVFEAPWHERDGRLRVVWDDAGRQRIYTRLDEELRRHSRALGASYIANPLWSFMEIRHLMTAHPIGGCPIGEDSANGAVDEFGRLFRGDGGVHEGLFVADGSLIPTSIGVNPFLTISALAEHIADRKIRQLKGDAYPQPRPAVAVPVLDPSEVVGMEEAELERLFRNRPPAEIDKIVNTGRHEIDVQAGVITNDTCWKGFFPKGHVLNAMSAALFTGFRKEFHKENGKYMGVTSDSDGRIRARTSVEEVVVGRGEGDLEPGRYLLLRYLDAPWQGFYDLLRVVQDNLIIGRVYLGAYPHGARLFTFAMTREYRLAQMTSRGSPRVVRARDRPIQGRSRRRVAHGRDFQRQPASGARVPGLRTEARRAAGKPLPVGRTHGGTADAAVPEGPFRAARFHALPRRDPQTEWRFAGGEVRDGTAGGPGAAGAGGLARIAPLRRGTAVRFLLSAHPGCRAARAHQHPVAAVPGRSSAGRPRDDVRRGDGGLVRRGAG